MSVEKFFQVPLDPSIPVDYGYHFLEGTPSLQAIKQQSLSSQGVISDGLLKNQSDGGLVVKEKRPSEPKEVTIPKSLAPQGVVSERPQSFSIRREAMNISLPPSVDVHEIQPNQDYGSWVNENMTRLNAIHNLHERQA